MDDVELSEVDLRRLSTQWSKVRDPQTFVLRYVHPIRGYLRCLLPAEDDVEEVLQRFMVKILERRFDPAAVRGDRLRNYLIRAIRNEAISWQREQSAKRGATLVESSTMDVREAITAQDQQNWNDDWQQSLLDRGLLALLAYEETHPPSWCHSVLTLATENPEMNSDELAARLHDQRGISLTAATFRKQLSRARRMLAEELVRQVAETIESANRVELLDELRVLGLATFVEPYITLREN
ncbi:MAG: sigma factor [Planctomycetota bacterium]